MPCRWRRCVSAVLVLHFAALLTAVVAVPGRNTPAPRLAVLAHQPVRPYLQALNLTCPYRFFAPQPGAVTNHWFRIEYADGSVRWWDCLDKHAHWMRPPYQRVLNMMLLLDSNIGPNLEQPGRLALSPLAHTCLASYARHVAHRFGDDGRPVRTVAIYTLHHYILEPEQVRAGWDVTDLRLFRPCLLGTYDAQGQLLDAAATPQAVSSSALAARIITDLRRGSMGPGFPAPVPALLKQHPDLGAWQGAEEALAQEIEARVEGGQ